MIRISDAEKEFYRQGIKLKCRVDGRGPLEYRHVTIDCGVIEQAAGSARVAIHGGDTDVIAAVKVELTEPREGSPNAGIIEADIDAFVPIAASNQRRAMIDAAQELTANLNALLNAPGAIDVDSLCVVPGQLVWHVYVDVIIVDAGGSLLDACALAACAALSNTELPKLKLIRGGEDGSRIDVDLDDGGDIHASVPFPAANTPVHLTFASIAGQTVVDTSVEEEAVASSRVRVAINRKGEVCLVATEAGVAGGDGGMAPQELHAAVEAARGMAPTLFGRVDIAVAAARGQGSAASGVDAAGAGSRMTMDKLGGLRAGGPGGFLSRSSARPGLILVDSSLRVEVKAGAGAGAGT